jgi:uncharacterized protein YlaN (UPF0358 family)
VKFFSLSFLSASFHSIAVYYIQNNQNMLLFSKTKKIKVEITANVCGAVQDILACKLFGMSASLGFAVKAQVRAEEGCVGNRIEQRRAVWGME